MTETIPQSPAATALNLSRRRQATCFAYCLIPLHKGATAAAGLLIGKSLSGTTRLAGGFLDTGELYYQVQHYEKNRNS